MIAQFTYARPDTWEALYGALAHHGAEAALYGGGTDLLVLLRAGKVAPAHLLDIKGLPGICDIAEQDGELVVGAACPFADIAASELVGKIAPGLAQAAGSVGSVQIRFKGTPGGNIATASPAGDSLVAAWGLEARVGLASAAGVRSMPLEAFVTGPRKTALQAGECIKAVLIPGHRWRYQRFFKVGRRNALAISVINGIVSIDLDKDGAVSGARIALGAVGPTPLRMTAAEQMLLGRRPGDVDPKELDRLVGDAVSPIDDIRASADYRRYMAQVWVRRLVQNGMGGEV